MYYKKLLLKRLIYRKSLSDDLEQKMVVKFQETQGMYYTKNIEKMVKDWRLSL